MSALTLSDAADGVISLALRREGADVHLCNAYTLALADRDVSLRRALCDAALNLPDGMSIAWASRLLGGRDARMSERVYGPDLLLAVADRGRSHGLRHYLYGGSTPAVLAAFQKELSGRFPGLDIAAAEVPPYTESAPDQDEALAKRIKRSEAHIVWVGLGTPKQDFTCARLAALAPVTFVGVGAAYDFLSGAKPQAPLWMQRSGLEWLYRLLREPRRLWRRYVFGNARFLYVAVIKDRRANGSDG